MKNKKEKMRNLPIRIAESMYQELFEIASELGCSVQDFIKMDVLRLFKQVIEEHKYGSVRLADKAEKK